MIYSVSFLGATRQSNLNVVPKQCLVIAMSLLVFVGCEAEKRSAELAKGNAPIGVATMSADRTIVLTLRAEQEGGAAFGDAQIRYPADHVEYQAVLKHIGGLKPGEEKSVAPWTHVRSQD